MLHLSALTLAASLAVAVLIASPASAEEDACAGQSWPNQSEECVKQIVRKVCEAGGGGKSCSGEEDSQSVDRATFNQYLALQKGGAPQTRKN